MKFQFAFGLAVGTAALAAASAAFAQSQPGPAPMLGAGLPGLAVLAAAGGSYLALRLHRRRRD
jgi:hypothetical protein